MALCLLPPSETWQTAQACGLIVAPLIWMWAMLSWLNSLIGGSELPTSIDDAFGFDERGVDAQNHLD